LFRFLEPSVKIAFLEPLHPVAASMVARFLAAHEVISPPAAGELPPLIDDAEAVIWSSWPVDRALIGRLPRLRFMQRLGVFRFAGDPSAAVARGIPVSVLPHGTSGRVAEHAFALMLALSRDLLTAHRAVLDGVNPAGLGPEAGEGAHQPLNWAGLPGPRSLRFRTVGILGFGEIGACLARLLAPFQCRVLYFKRRPLTSEQEHFYGVVHGELDEILMTSDSVCNLIPANEQTRGMLGAREFGLMKHDAHFVSCGRGMTTDERALAAALAEGRIGGAGLDVFSIEPIPRDDPFLGLSNVILTPHIAGGTPLGAPGGSAGWSDTFERLAENLRRVQDGEPILSPIDPREPPAGG
jgi:phosphoglycerate dehydrogenase-like enzyme